MRTFLLTATPIALALCATLAPAAAEAQGLGLVMRLSGSLSQVEQLNQRRQQDAAQYRIALAIGQINARFADLQYRRLPQRQALAMIYDSLGEILRDNARCRFVAPYLAMQTERLALQMRFEIRRAQMEGRGWGRGWRGGYGRQGYPGAYGQQGYPGAYGQQGYPGAYGQQGMPASYVPQSAPADSVPPPLPAERDEDPLYVPPPPVQE